MLWNPNYFTLKVSQFCKKSPDHRCAGFLRFRSNSKRVGLQIFHRQLRVLGECLCVRCTGYRKRCRADWLRFRDSRSKQNQHQCPAIECRESKSRISSLQHQRVLSKLNKFEDCQLPPFRHSGGRPSPISESPSFGPFWKRLVVHWRKLIWKKSTFAIDQLWKQRNSTNRAECLFKATAAAMAEFFRKLLLNEICQHSTYSASNDSSSRDWVFRPQKWKECDSKEKRTCSLMLSCSHVYFNVQEILESCVRKIKETLIQIINSNQSLFLFWPIFS